MSRIIRTLVATALTALALAFGFAINANAATGGWWFDVDNGNTSVHVSDFSFYPDDGGCTLLTFGTFDNQDDTYNVALQAYDGDDWITVDSSEFTGAFSYGSAMPAGEIQARVLVTNMTTGASWPSGQHEFTASASCQQ